MFCHCPSTLYSSRERFQSKPLAVFFFTPLQIQSFFYDRQGWSPQKVTSSSLCCLCHKFECFFLLPMTSTSRCRLSRERERASRSQDHSQLSNMTLFFLNVSADMSFMGNEIWGALTLIWLSNAYIFIFYLRVFRLFAQHTAEEKMKSIAQKTQFFLFGSSLRNFQLSL